MLSLLAFLSFVFLSEQCCLPAEWEAEEHVITAVKEDGKIGPTITKSTFKISWESPMRRYYVEGTSLTNGVATSFRQLNDYISNVQYSVIGGKCNVSNIAAPFSMVECTPANATKSSMVSLGLGQLSITQYSWNADGTTVYGNYADGCTPVSFTSYGIVKGVPTFQSGSFDNLTVGLKDRSIFNIPVECRGTSLNTVG